MYARITNGEYEIRIPETGILKDGRTVSNYNLLPTETLKAEGWKPMEEVKPTYDEATQYLAVDTAIDMGDKITVTYKAVDIPIR